MASWTSAQKNGGEPFGGGALAFNKSEGLRLGGKGGRDWLRDNRDEMVAWVQKSDTKARAELLKALNASLRSKQEDQRYTANMLAAKWGLETSDG